MNFSWKSEEGSWKFNKHYTYFRLPSSSFQPKQKLTEYFSPQFLPDDTVKQQML